jgi:formate C-acetyltransferase
VTYLVLDIVEELHISDFPVAVRVSGNTPDKLWRRIAEVQRTGGGIVSIYNEDLVIRALTRFGFPLRDARSFANDGCWEVLIPGKTCFGYIPFDALQLLQEAMGTHPEHPSAREFASFEALYAAFEERFAEKIRELYSRQIEEEWHYGVPTPLLGLWVEGCIEKGLEYGNRGPKYTVYALHAGGLPDVANSLHAIKALVFDQGRVSYAQMRDILQKDWAGHDQLQSEAWRRVVLYGNDDAEADTMLGRVFETYVTLCERTGRADPSILRPPGISTFGREIEWRHLRAATPFGRKAGDILSSNLSPTPGSERYGPTAVIRSYAKPNFERLPNGVPLDLKLLPANLRGPAGIETIVALIKTFIDLGGWYLQLDMVDSEQLRDAQRHPERYPNLTVRVSGWSARFSTLGKEWQDMVIQRTAHEI